MMQRTPEDPKPSSAGRLAVLRERFIEGLEPRLVVLRLHLSELGSDDAVARRALAELHLGAHSMAGTAGLHGLAGLGAAARHLELAAQRQISDEASLTSAVVEALDWRLSAVEDAARSTPALSSERQPAEQAAASGCRRVLIVDDDMAAAEVIKEQLIAQGYEPEILSSLEQFSASCAPGLEPPAAVIMDMVFPQGNIAGAEAVAEQLQSAHSMVPVIFVSVRDDMAARLAAQRVGATAYLVKPFDPAVLTLKLDQVTAREGAADYRVLVVDDDAEALELTLTLLTQAGMTAEGVSDPMQAFEAAMRLQPDCVVLDLHMPRCGGAELAAVLRADARFLDTPIVYLSDEWDFGRQLHALDMGGDLFLNKSESGGPLRLVGAVRMRARRAREVRRLGDSVKRSLREATRYRHAVDCHALVSVTDRHGTIVDVNDHFCEVSGYARSELLGQHHRILKSGVHPDAFYEDIWKTIGSGRVWHGEICDRNKAGGLFWMACSFVPFLDDTGAPYQYMATYTDISAHKDAQALLIAAKEQAEAANGAKTVFLRTMSHELRTPLNAVLGFSQLLDMKLESPESKSFVTGILHAGNHLLDLITEILDYASIESGRVNLTIEPVALQELCGESLGMIEQLASKRGIVIRHDAAQYAGVTVCADRVRLKQALLNYLSNAVKYNRNHGELRLDLSLGDAGRIRVAVADAGPGLSEQQIEMLFQPFVRLPQHVNRVEGTGIGLAITKRLVEAMGGSVGAQSEPGVGSCFWLELPAGPGVEARLPCP